MVVIDSTRSQKIIFATAILPLSPGNLCRPIFSKRCSVPIFLVPGTRTSQLVTHCIVHWSQPQWREFQSFDIKWSSLTLTKIHRSYFKDIRFSIKLWGQSFKYLTSISQSGNHLVNCHGDQSYSWFSATNILSHTLIGQFIFETATPGTSPSSVMVEVTKIHFFFNQRFHLKVHRNQW